MGAGEVALEVDLASVTFATSPAPTANGHSTPSAPKGTPNSLTSRERATYHPTLYHPRFHLYTHPVSILTQALQGLFRELPFCPQLHLQ